MTEQDKPQHMADDNADGARDAQTRDAEAREHGTAGTPGPGRSRGSRHLAGYSRRRHAALGRSRLGPERHCPGRPGHPGPADLHRQRHGVCPCRPAGPDPWRTADRQHGQAGGSHGKLPLCQALGLLIGCLDRRDAFVRRAVPGLRVQPPRLQRSGAVRTADGDPHHCNTADHSWPGRGAGLPRRPVQHRCPGPDHHGRHPRRLGGLCAAPARGPAPAAGPRRRHHRRRHLGRTGGRCSRRAREPTRSS